MIARRVIPIHAQPATTAAAEARRQRLRLATQMGFFVLFVLAPVFDLLRYDLPAGHGYFLGREWHLGIDAYLAGRIGAAEAAARLGLYGLLPLAAVALTVLGVAWKWGRLYCGWLCPHFSVVETINRLMRRASGKPSLWEARPLPARQPDGRIELADPRLWLLVLPLAAAFAFTWAVVLLTYLMPPLDLYPRLLAASLQRGEVIFLTAATLVLTVEFVFARHLFCKYACAVGMFQSLAWMGNRDALVVGVDRARMADCADCLHGEGAACEAVCPMRLNPRTLKRLMFACTQCAQCIDACATVQHDAPAGSLLRWVDGEAARQHEAGFKTHRGNRMGREND